jgi:hypothetical protein
LPNDLTDLEETEVVMAEVVVEEVKDLVVVVALLNVVAIGNALNVEPTILEEILPVSRENVVLHDQLEVHLAVEVAMAEVVMEIDNLLEVHLGEMLAEEVPMEVNNKMAVEALGEVAEIMAEAIHGEILFLNQVLAMILGETTPLLAKQEALLGGIENEVMKEPH